MARQLGRTAARRQALIVLDTNVVLRVVTGEGHVGRQARQELDKLQDRTCSTMMQWELAMLGENKLRFDMPIADWVENARTLLRFSDTPVSAAIARDAGSLPGPIHGNPCDRIMIATARALRCPLMTTDEKIIDYAATGHVQAIDARR